MTQTDFNLVNTDIKFRFGLSGKILEIPARPKSITDAKFLAENALMDMGVLPPRMASGHRVHLVQNDTILEGDVIWDDSDITVIVDSEKVRAGLVGFDITWTFEATGELVTFSTTPTTIWEARLMISLQNMCCSVIFTVDGQQLHDDSVLEDGSAINVNLMAMRFPFVAVVQDML